MDSNQLIKALTVFRTWFKANKAQATAEQKEREHLAECTQSFTKERLLNMSETDFFEYIAPLWAMAMWGNKHYQVDNVIEANGMPLLREQFSNLLYGQSSLEKRWDEFRSKIKGVGPAIMSELLCKTYPDKYLLWNKKTYNGFSALQIPNLPRYEARLTGKTYEYLCAKGRDIVAFAKADGYAEVSDMLTLNTFIWQQLQINNHDNLAKPDTQEELTPKSKKEALFVHNDVRDKLADIGRFLGFRSEVEKKVADGAVVDAVWEVTIGNMGRIIYVFEVQTSGSIDSLILNLIRAKNNQAVQRIIAVSDQHQIEKIRKEVAGIKEIKDDIKYWDYTEVLKIHDSMQFVNESINNLGLVPSGF
ncbi:hypothetical protein [uncultured Alistipes sp.]|jgi:hypothetical protein|uniref:hypothetical protein n=1 Tax=Alistipes sp. TaxID=1872444 RepID=UPI0025FA959F|nr:hypothetical protein [uncultured Alistipes sp.]